MEVTLKPAEQKKDREFARQVHHEAYRDVVTRQFGAWDIKQQDGFFEKEWDCPWGDLSEQVEKDGITTDQINSTATVARTYNLILMDSAPVGVVVFEVSHTHLFLSELQILPQYQNQGVGSAVLKLLMQEAQNKARPLRLQVLRENSGARRLYERFGFQPVLSEHGNETHVVMEWQK